MPGRSDVAAVAPRLLSVIVLASPVSQAVWRPSSSGSETNEVAIVCQSQAVYFWRLQARTAGQIVEAIPIPIGVCDLPSDITCTTADIAFYSISRWILSRTTVVCARWSYPSARIQL